MMLLRPRLAIALLVLAGVPAGAACSAGSYTTTGAEAGAGATTGAGSTAICAKRPSLTCWAGVNSATTTSKCEAAVSDPNCGALYEALGECAIAAATQQNICPGMQVSAGTCTTEAQAYSACEGGDTGTTTSPQPRDGGTSTSDASSTCRGSSTCINGACKCIDGPRAQQPCQQTNPETTTYCDTFCRFCD